MKDLGTLPGDAASVALGINDSGTVIGPSLDASFNGRPFVWQSGRDDRLHYAHERDESPIELSTEASAIVQDRVRSGRFGARPTHPR